MLLFERQINKGGGRFARQIILNPKKAGLTSLWLQDPRYNILTQLLAYPYAFGNTIMKRFAKGMLQGPVQSAQALVGGTMMAMTGIMGNEWRTQGERDWVKRSDAEVISEGIKRVGGLGMLEYVWRGAQAAEYTNWGGILTMLKVTPLLGSPTGSDLIDFFTGRKSMREILVTKSPVYQAYPKHIQKQMQAWAKEGTAESRNNMYNFLKGKGMDKPEKLAYPKRKPQFKGGAVSEDYPVPNVIKDPSERINPYTGQPYDAEMERLGLAEGSEVKAEPLLQRILQNIVRASPEEERELSETKGYENTPKNKRYGEVKGNKVYIFEDRLREDGSTGNFVEDMFFGEALHRLKDTAPEWYDRLYSAANKDPEVMKWKEEAYQRAIDKGEYKGTREQHWNESRFDQIVGGFLLGRPDANVHTMRGWDRNTLPYGTHLRKELEAFEKELGRTKKKDGGLMVSIGVAPVSEKQIDKLKKALEKRKAKRDGGSADIEEIVVKALKRIPQKGKEAYEYAIDKMGENNLDKQFLKEIAYVESKYAEDEGSFRKDNRSAYQITPLAFQEFKETINPNSSRGRGLRAYANKIKDRYDVDISKVTYDELNDPLIGTAVTRALWKLDPEPIGNTVKERANQWKRYWNTEEGKGTVDRYLDDVTFMNK